MKKVGIVAGSFDPITRGHEFLIVEASRLVDELYVVVGVNPSKRYTFTDDQRINMVELSLAELGLCSAHSGAPQVTTILNTGNLLIDLAGDLGATHLFRGIRDTNDLNYELQIQAVNRKINPNIQTVFFSPPAEYTEVSSSTVKGLVGFRDWEHIVSRYVREHVIRAFKEVQQ